MQMAGRRKPATRCSCPGGLPGPPAHAGARRNILPPRAANEVTMSSTRKILTHHFRHFNARTLVDAAKGWVELLEKDGKMVVSLAGAMSTAELGVSLAQMIREDKVHAISCTGANLEEDVFNLV